MYRRRNMLELAGKCQSKGKPKKKPRKEGKIWEINNTRSIAREAQERRELYRFPVADRRLFAGDEKNNEKDEEKTEQWERQSKKKRGFGFLRPTPLDIGGYTAGIWRTVAEEGENENGEGGGSERVKGMRKEEGFCLSIYIHI